MRCAEGLSCLVPDPDEPDTVSLCYDCRAQDAIGVGGCEVEVGTFWDAVRCETRSGCSCEGADCEAAFESVDACLRAVGRTCAALAP